MAHRLELFRPKPGGPQSERVSVWLAVGLKVLNIAIVVAVLALAYLIYGLLSQEYSRFPGAADGVGKLTDAQQAKLLSDFKTGLTIFAAAAWLCCLLALALIWEGESATFVVAGIGVLAYVGLPLLIELVLGRQHLQPNSLTDQMKAAFQSVGKVALVFSMLRFVGRTLFSLATRPAVRKEDKAAAPVIEIKEGIQQKAAAPRERPHLIRRCWEMAYCSDSLRYNCPSYLTKTPCWRRRTGCQCDPYFAARVLEPMYRAGRMTLSAEDQSAMQHMRSQSAWTQKHHADRETCRRCTIYGEHQHYKYRALFWLAYPATGAAVYFGWPIIDRAYQWIENAATSVARGLAVLPNTQPELAPFVNDVVGLDIEYVVVGAVALVVVAWLLRAFEWAIFEAKV